MHMYVDVILIIMMMTIMIIMIIMIIIMIIITIMIQCTYYRSHENVWNSNSISKHVFKLHIYQQILVSNRRHWYATGYNKMSCSFVFQIYIPFIMIT